MNRLIKILFLMICILSMPVMAQDQLRADAAENLVIDHESGSYATNIVDLVRASDVIFLGTYGELISRQLFYGYGSSREQFKEEFGIEDEEFLDRAGIPMSEYSLNISQLFKGDELVEEGVILRVYEHEEVMLRESLIDYRKGNHLFFLTLNPDNRTYALRGSMFDMKENEDSFYFMNNGFDSTAFGSKNKKQFLEEVQTVIRESK